MKPTLLPHFYFFALFFDRNHFAYQITKHFAMNTLNKSIKISVLFSMIAIGATLAGCASRSSKTGTVSAANTSSAAVEPASSNAATPSNATDASGAATSQQRGFPLLTDSIAAGTAGSSQGASNGLPAITWDELTALRALGTPAAQPAQ